MKIAIRKTTSVFMALVVLFTTMSFSVDMHFCGDTLVDFSIFHKVETCGMDENQPDAGCDNPMLTKGSCCTDHHLAIEGQNNLRPSAECFSCDHQAFLLAFSLVHTNLYIGALLKDVPYTEYSPPYVKRDVQVLHQSFLI